MMTAGGVRRMSAKDTGSAASSLPHRITVAFVGNPNTGKTTLFNALAGMRQRVGNYPGVTVEMKKGHMTYGGRSFELIDLPGTYSLAPRSPDEMVAVDLLLGHQQGERRPDVVVTIVDASNLERNCYLTTQALELGLPVVVALNMVDVAEAQGIRIDASRLSERLGLQVVPIQANKRKGLDELKKAILRAAEERAIPSGPIFPEAFEAEARALRDVAGSDVSFFLIRRLLLDVGGHTERRLAERYGGDLRTEVLKARQRLASAGCPVPAVEARTRYGWIREMLAGCVERPPKRPVTWTDRLDRVLTHKVWGTLLFLAVMFVVFQSIFTWAKPFMDLIGKGQDALGGAVRDALPPGPLRGLLVDGIIKGVGSVLVFLPQIVILFGFIAILEDCGYMARAAFLMDKLMSRCGLSGKSFIPMLSSIACAVPGIMAARVIENRRDRFATILVAPLMSCSARLPVYMLLIGAFLGPARGFAWWVPGVTLFGLYLLGLVVAPLMAFLLKRTLLRGETPVFVMEMPLYKRPSLRAVFQRMAGSGWMFVRRAGTLILATMIVVWALLYFPVSDPEGGSYDARIATLEDSIGEGRAERDALKADVKATGTTKARAARLQDLEEKLKPVEDDINRLQTEWTSRSWLGQMGKTIEPAVAPLGWDWKIGMAAIASFPAREVMVGTLGIIYGQGKVDADEIRDAGLSGKTELSAALQQEEVFTVPVALSVMVFFALCCQCASTLAVIRRETNSWRWPLFTFVYMTALAYVGALVVYQVGRLFT
jgi:ferrous iron transport protein B